MSKIVQQLLRDSPFLAFGEDELRKLSQRFRSKRSIFARFGYQWKDNSGNRRLGLSIALRDRLRELFGQVAGSLHAAHDLNYSGLRAQAGKPVLHKIVFDILSADLLFFDVTYPNPNVFFELGIAYAANKNLFLLRDKLARYVLPSDLAGLTYCDYKFDGGLELGSNCENDIKAAMRGVTRKKLSLHK